MARPYQPSLLRLLHVPTALLVVGLWITGLIVNAVYDGRGLRLPPGFGGVDWIDVHGSLGVALVLLTSLFVPYALTVGRSRLRRASNLLPLLALLLSVGSGLLMAEDEVRGGVTDTLFYGLHLTGWGLMALAVLLHLAGVLRRGGWSLASSMFRADLRAADRPADWAGQLHRHFLRR
jgi:hypothetical protein